MARTRVSRRRLRGSATSKYIYWGDLMVERPIPGRTIADIERRYFAGMEYVNRLWSRIEGLAVWALARSDEKPVRLLVPVDDASFHLVFGEWKDMQRCFIEYIIAIERTARGNEYISVYHAVPEAFRWEERRWLATRLHRLHTLYTIVLRSTNQHYSDMLEAVRRLAFPHKVSGVAVVMQIQVNGREYIFSDDARSQMDAIVTPWHPALHFDLGYARPSNDEPTVRISQHVGTLE